MSAAFVKFFSWMIWNAIRGILYQNITIGFWHIFLEKGTACKMPGVDVSFLGLTDSPRVRHRAVILPYGRSPPALGA